MPRPRDNSAPDAAAETARLAELERYQLLDTPEEPVFDDLARLAAQVCATPMALISLADRTRHWFKSAIGVNLKEVPRQQTFCEQTILQNELLEVPDAAADPRFASCLLLAGEPPIRFYAGVPLWAPSGHALGTVCVLDTTPRQLEARQKESLSALSRQVLAQMELKRTIAELRRTAAERQQVEAALRKSEERFQKFMNSGPAIAYIKDESGRFVYVNEPLARRFQKAASEWIGKTDAEVVGPEAAENVLEHDLTVLNHEQAVVAEEVVPTPDGSARYWLSHKFLLYDDLGQKQVGGLSVDITARKAAEQERERLVSDLREALAEVRTLSGFLPICAACKKIRDDAGYWQQIESYLSTHAGLEFTHGICPDCLAKLYPEFSDRED